MTPRTQNSALGPCPAVTISALADLGLSHQALARYFRLRPEQIREAAESAWPCSGVRDDHQLEFYFMRPSVNRFPASR